MGDALKIVINIEVYDKNHIAYEEPDDTAVLYRHTIERMVEEALSRLGLTSEDYFISLSMC